MINALLNNKHFKYGGPFILSVVGGSFLVQFYSQLRYDVQNEKKFITKTPELQSLIEEAKKVTLEGVYEEYKQTVDLDNWKNIRGPRPWEEGGEQNEDFKQLIERRAQESKKGWLFR